MCNDIILKLRLALRLLGITTMFMKGCLRFDGIGPRKSKDSVDFRADSRNSKINWIVMRIPFVLCQPWFDPLLFTFPA